MTRHDDGGLPSADIGFDPLDQDRSTENSTVQSRTDRSVGALVHSLQIVFLYTSRIWGNSRALDSDTIFFRGFCSIYCDLVIGLIPLRESEVIILCLEIDVGKKEIILDHFPDDTGHLISIHLYKRSLHHNFAHSPSSLRFIVLSGGPKDRRRLPDYRPFFTMFSYALCMCSHASLSARSALPARMASMIARCSLLEALPRLMLESVFLRTRWTY